MQFKIEQGMNQDILKTYPDNHFDSIVTDPPYGIEFLGKDWDNNTGAIETWEQCYRVLKPGGHILAFSAARTYHHLATNIESVGFEIRDQIMWIYASGFPKAQDIGKAIDKRAGKLQSKTYLPNIEDNREVKNSSTGSPRCNMCHTSYGVIHKKCNREDCIKPWEQTSADNEWSGWKTALKPAHEPIVMARKPFKGSAIDNVLKHGTGALNIDATRIQYDGQADIDEYLNNKKGPMERGNGVDGERIGMFENKVGFKNIKRTVTVEDDLPEQGRFPSNVLGEIADYQKYFYCPKVSRAERHTGFEQTDIPTSTGGMYDDHGTGKMYNVATDMTTKKINANNKPTGNVGNNHPTVKPVELMKYLVRLVTPSGGKVLDPFNGSGSTGMAAVEMGFDYTGCELDPAYVNIANKRITAWFERTRPTNTFNNLFE
tara:strand:+ start:3885 stop:5174 length:1290 start_codon:yes stop_codon:yes gene_type:complete